MRLGDQPVSPLEILYCATCDQAFSAIDLALFRFDWETMTCHECQQARADDSARTSCFAKDGPLGYDPDSLECGKLCPDRKLCPAWKEGSLPEKIVITEAARKAAVSLFRSDQYKKAKRRRVQRSHPFMRGSIALVIYELAVKGTTVDKIRELCAQIGADPAYYFRIFRKGFANGFKWRCEEDDEGSFRIYPEGRA